MMAKKKDNETADDSQEKKDESPPKETPAPSKKENKAPAWRLELKNTKKEPQIKPGVKIIKRGFRSIWIEEEPPKKMDVPKIDGKLKPSEWALRYGLDVRMIRPHDKRFEKGLSQSDFEKEFKRYLPVR